MLLLCCAVIKLIFLKNSATLYFDISLSEGVKVVDFVWNFDKLIIDQLRILYSATVGLIINKNAYTASVFSWYDYTCPSWELNSTSEEEEKNIKATEKQQISFLNNSKNFIFCFFLKF